MIIIKKCRDCGRDLELNRNNFFSNLKSKDGFRSNCKLCFYHRHLNKEYSFIKNIKITKNHHVASEEEMRIRRKEYYLKNKEKRKQYYQDNKEKINDYQNNRLKNNIEARIAKNCRTRTKLAVTKNGYYKQDKTFNLIGCTPRFLKEYLESLFVDGMSWDNYGFGDNKWNIDHIKPCEAFDLSITEEQLKCFHYTNLQPLWQSDNLEKSNKII